MHLSSLENMQKCYDRYVHGTAFERQETLRVLDVGGADVNGSYSNIFNADNVVYLGADLAEGPGVSVVLDDPHKIPLPDGSVDFVISGQMLEHCEFFWLVFAEMVRVVKDDGFIFLIAPSGGPIHKYPVDCYRFYPDAFRALAKLTDCHAIDVWRDNRGPWNDLVGVFSKSGKIPKKSESTNIADVRAINEYRPKGKTEYDYVSGETPYMEVMSRLHDVLKPRHYLEIGVRTGKSLALAQCPAVGVDPMPAVNVKLSGDTRLVEQKSDDFFEAATDPILSQKPDFVFIDGMHLFENALRDFMNVEEIAGPDTVVVIDDIFPNNPQQATRERQTVYWTGDVWKLHEILKKFRPDLSLIALDTDPTGLLMVTGLKPNNRVLWTRYNPITSWARTQLNHAPANVTERHGKVSPTGPKFGKALNIIKQARLNNVPLVRKAPQIKDAID